jgi:hypothetical protein
LIHFWCPFRMLWFKFEEIPFSQWGLFVLVFCRCCLRADIIMQSSEAVSLFGENIWCLNFISPLGHMLFIKGIIWWLYSVYKLSHWSKLKNSLMYFSLMSIIPSLGVSTKLFAIYQS